MNVLMKKLWVLLAQRKLNSANNITKFNAIELLGEYGGIKHLSALAEGLASSDAMIRNASVQAMQLLIQRFPSEQFLTVLQESLTHSDLIEKLAVIEVLGAFDLSTREKLLTPFLFNSTNDLLFAVVIALRGSQDIALLDKFLEISITADLTLRRATYTSWFAGIAAMETEQRLEYCTPYIHELIRATYEMNAEGDILFAILAHANRKLLPPAKAYPEFIQRYLLKLIHMHEYDADVYRNLHQLVVPAYFIFANESEDTLFIRV